jgi:polysaccharide deacetylase family protein (PEP-CTERM system associated)
MDLEQRRAGRDAGDPSTGARNGAPIRRRHVLTVMIEDYFAAAPFRRWIREDMWYRFEERLTNSTHRTLDLLDGCRAQATFFVTSRIAEASPDLIREIASRGHEVASAGEHHGNLAGIDRAKFRASVARSRQWLEQIIGRQVVGFRMAGGWLSEADVWILDELAEAGYSYDSSIRAAMFSDPEAVWRRAGSGEDRRIREVPVSALGLLGFQIPIAGGGPFRHYPEQLTRVAVAHWDRRRRDPFVMAIRTWEMDAEQPRISVAPLHARVRHYRNLRHMPRLLGELLSSYHFTSVAGHLDLALAPVAPAITEPGSVVIPHVRGPVRSGPAPIPVSVVIPCYNETQALRYLNSALRDLCDEFATQYRFTFLFVDDCSTDETWKLLHEVFGGRPDCVFLRHEHNRGVAAAIQTGIRHAPDEIVSSIDCDCTYDPRELGRMIPLLADGVDVVTASPYHPEGGVRNVPAWRLFLSKSASWLYRLVLRQKLHTYTSCFRVYRRRSAEAAEIRLPGFLGVAEMLARIDMAGGRVVEYPTTLEVRVLGFSKMKVVRTIVGHLGFLTGLVRQRLFHRAIAAADPAVRDPGFKGAQP